MFAGMTFGESAVQFYASGWNNEADFGYTSTALYNRSSSTEPFGLPKGVAWAMAPWWSSFYEWS